VIVADLETFSSVPIADGSWAYAEGARVLLYAYALDDDTAQVWSPVESEPMPADLHAALTDDEQVLVGFNWAMFDHVVLTVTGSQPIKPLRLVHDVMVQAALSGWPLKLETLCAAVGVPKALTKMSEGRRLIHKFCKPNKQGKSTEQVIRENPEDWALFKEYAKHDVEATRYLYKRLPKINYPNNPEIFQTWLLDQEINHRGLEIDTQLVRAAIDTAGQCVDDINARLYEATDNKVETATQSAALLAYLNNLGVGLRNLTKASVAEAIPSCLHDTAIEILQMRQEVGKTSVAKYKKIERATSSDGRLRGTFQFAGAGRTGRWAGRVVQTQNFARPAKEYKSAAAQEQLVEAAKSGALPLIELKPMAALSSALRGSFLLRSGAVADLSNIEGRLTAWLAGEKWKLQAFRDYDNGIGADLYKISYANAFQAPVDEVTDDDRNLGKVLELSMGYAGGVGAFVVFADVYRIDLDALVGKVQAVAPPELIEEAKELLYWRKGDTQDLSEETWLACDVAKRMWRAANPNIVDYWATLRNAAVQALRSPLQTFPAGRVACKANAHGCLMMRLPSGRVLFYQRARCDQDQLSYEGMNQYTHKWERIKTHKGKLLENAVSALAVDVFAHGMRLAASHGARIVLHAHDEMATEGYPLEDLIAGMSTVPVWADGLPLSAAGFTADRYRKA
jgi:DNA polymerase